MWYTCTCIPLSPAPQVVRKALGHRWREYTNVKKLRIGIGTWNVNGGRHVRSIAMKNQSMHEWLLDAPLISNKSAAVSAGVVHLTVVYEFVSSSLGS